VVLSSVFQFIYLPIQKIFFFQNWKRNLEFGFKGGLILGLFGAINLVFVGYSIPTSRVPGPLQAVVSQSTMPFTVLSTWILCKKYPQKIQQWIGILLVVCGLVAVVIPAFINNSGGGDGQPLFIVFCIVGNAIVGPSAVLFEKATLNRNSKKRVISAWYAVGVQSFWSTVFLWIALPINFLPTFSGVSTADQFWTLMKEAWLCTWIGNGGDTGNICDHLMVVIILLSIVVAIYNTIAAYMNAVDSANYTQIANCVGGVFSTYYYFIPVLSGITYAPFGILIFSVTTLAMVLMIGGTILYKYYEVEETDHSAKSRIDWLMLTSDEKIPPEDEERQYIN